jgi:cytochrome bd-type quinol oxidase subunit 2
MGREREVTMSRRFIISVVVMLVLGMGLGFLIHGVLLYDDYARLPNVMRPPAQAQAKMPLMVLAYVCIALAFTWIYVKGRENKPWLAQGARYGAAIAVLTAVPTYLIYHVVSQFPFDLAVKQIVLDSITLVVMGIVLARIYRVREKSKAVRGE